MRRRVRRRQQQDRTGKQAHSVVFDRRAQLGQQAPRLLDKRSEVSALAKRIEIPQAVQLRNLANLRLRTLQVAGLFVFILVGRCSAGRRVLEVLEEEGHELAEPVLEEFGKVLRVEVVVELKEEQECA